MQRIIRTPKFSWAFTLLTLTILICGCSSDQLATSTPEPTIEPPTPQATPTEIISYWQEVRIGSARGGGISNNNSRSWHPSIAIAPDNSLYIAWHDWVDEKMNNEEIFVRHWNGSDWEEVSTNSARLGGISQNKGVSSDPTIAIASSGMVYVAWQDMNTINYEIYLRTSRGGSWEEVGIGSAHGGGISLTPDYSNHPTMVVASHGMVYVAWEEGGREGNREIYVLRWNIINWTEVGTNSASYEGISNNSGFSSYPSLAIDSGGTLYAAWADDSSGNFEIYVRRFTGTVWEEVGVGSASGAGISSNNGRSDHPRLAITPDGTPYVAWCDDSNGNNEIYIRRWSGSSWEEVGSGSASGGGISNNSGASSIPSIAISPVGVPYVTWTDDSSGNFEVYIRKWDGSNWAEVGIGSASDGGISDNSGESYTGSIAISPENVIYVTWFDNTSGNFEIYIKQYLE